MKVKSFLLYISLFALLYSSAVAQIVEQNTPGLLRIEPQENGAGQVTTNADKNIFRVTTVGGFIKIQPKGWAGESGSRFHLKKYFNLGDTSKVAQVISQADEALKGFKIYLLPGQEYVIEVLQTETNLLVYKYIVRRPVLIPKVSFFDPDNKTQSLWDSFSDTNMSGGFSFAPGSKLSMSVMARSEFKNLSLEYSLRNLKTRKEVVGIFFKGLDELPIEANTSYRLQLSYSMQKEVSVVVYISKGPFWYQSIKTYGIFGVIVLIIVLLVITKNMRKLLGISKRRQQQMEDAATRLQAQLNPHFTFNALSAIQGLMNTGRIDDANFYLQEFSSLLRKTLANSDRLYNNLGEELNMMEIYLRLEALRFNFTWNVMIDSKLRPAEINIPTMIIQPIVENAVKHGISNLKDKGKLNIVCQRGEKDHTFVLIISDNGSWKDKSSTSGYGLSLTRKRIDAINKLNSEQLISLEIKTQSGTEIVIKFYNWINT